MCAITRAFDYTKKWVDGGMKNVLIVWRIQFWINISQQLSIVRECFVALGFQKCRLLFSTAFCVGRTCGPFGPY